MPEHISRALTATFCFFYAGTSVQAAEAWVVTDRLHPVQTIPDVRVIELDGPAHIEAELTAQLPPHPEKAAEIVRQHLQSGGADLHRRLAVAYQGVIDSWGLGIVKLPAVVVDRQYVVYGERDVERAIAKIKEYRSAHP